MASLQSVSTINSPSGRGNVAMGYMLQSSPLLRFLDAQSAFELDATTSVYRPADTSSSAPARALGANFTPSTVTPDDSIPLTLAIHGDAVQMDISYMADSKRGLAGFDNWFAKQLRKTVTSFAKTYEGKIMSSPGTSNSFTGLKTILNGTDDVPGYTGVKRVKNAKDIASSGDYLDVSTDAGIARLVELLHSQTVEVDNPTGIILNRSLAARLTVQAKAAGLLGSQVDTFGIPQNTFNGIPFVIVGDSAITLAEPDDDSPVVNQTTSLYIVSPGEQRFSLVTNSGLYWVDWDHQDNAEKNKELWEIRAAWKIEEPEAVLRIRNIKL